jgi:hypothetical protein
MIAIQTKCNTPTDPGLAVNRARQGEKQIPSS